ncbi:hypothetical protein [Pseudomonas fluorescens]|uniref:Uncharacterized protein n=1 Tax=Pseudomonas fluorescens TaxID=294 RepID=A0A5E7UZZ4_PSEFL|nr:hypothetical protein [Pseudomonas fluorescens]VVQ16135.1 hypothetical protein PS928_04343 [Pseudomonas fluorescens]
MFEVIGIIVALIFGWAVIKMIAARVFPAYGLKVAERRYMKEPDATNERLLWDARHRLNKRNNR